MIDMENDIKDSFIYRKVRASKNYAQSLYAAMCNNVFVKEGVEWSCSWRSSGAVVSSMRTNEDYIDYYCSGMGVFEERPATKEGEVTDEIREDLARIGWSVKDGD
jgi:hypothetical protein